jgi:hypothetical protein
MRRKEPDVDVTDRMLFTAWLPWTIETDVAAARASRGTQRASRRGRSFESACRN